MIDRLLESLSTIPIKSIAPANPGLPAGPGNITINYRPEATAQHQTDANAVVASFDWSEATHDAWLLSKLRALANTQFYNKSAIEMGVRSLLDVLVDEVNALRERCALTLVGTGQTNPAWDAPNIANAAGAASPAITVTGAQVGDRVDVSPPVSTAGLIVYGYVSAANTVIIRLHNSTGGAINLASGIWGVAVWRFNALAPRTLQQARNAVANKIDTGAAD